MWNLGKQSKGHTDLSKGTGLAILARVVGVDEIEAEVLPFHEQIKATKEVKSYSERMLAQQKIQTEVARICRKLELEVTKKYEMSRKSIYGVENELHLVEQIQKALDVITEFSQSHDLKTSIVKSMQYLIKKKRQEDIEGVESYFLKQIELTEQMHLVLKLAMNLKHISKNQNVKEFFFARFKRQLYKKNLMNQLQAKIDLYIMETDLNIRSQNNSIILICFKI